MKLVILTFSLMLALFVGVALLPGPPRAYSEPRATSVPLTPAPTVPFPTPTPWPIGYLPPVPPPPYPEPAAAPAPVFRLLLPLARG